MKIALVYDLIYPFSIGGAEARYFSLAKHLVLKGHEVHLFGAKMWPGNNRLRVTKGMYVHGVSRYKTKYNFKGNRRIIDPIIYSLKLFFELRKYKFDVIDVSAFPYFPYFACKLCSLTNKVPVVVTWHEVWDEYWFKYWNRFSIRGFIGRMIERIVANSSKNICVSHLVAKQLKKIGGKNIEVINNWVDFEEIHRAKKSNQEYDIISIGRMLKHKNFDLLLRCCAILIKDHPNIKVLIIGDGPELFKLLSLRKALNLEKNVEILSFAKKQETMYGYLKSSKIFVLLSELEGFSITTFEAMACGLPVVTIKSKRNALAEFIENGKNGYVCGKSEVEVAHLAEQLLSSKSKKLINGAIKTVRKYDSNKICDMIEKYYCSMK